MDQIISLTESELLDIKDNVEETLLKMKKGVFKKKLELIGKSLLKVTLIIGGVTVAIIFPSAIVLAALGGVVAVLDGSRGSVKAMKKVKRENKKRKTGKQELKEVDSELTKRKTVREFIQQQQPSAPPLYPGL